MFRSLRPLERVAILLVSVGAFLPHDLPKLVALGFVVAAFFFFKKTAGAAPLPETA